MSQHIPETLLAQFVEGNLEEPVAIAVAKHLDGCSRCASAATAKEPLSYHFAQVDDPEVPSDLTAKIHEALAQEEESPAPASQTDSIALFLIAAALLLAIIISPLGFLEGTQSALSGLAARSEATLGIGLSVGIAAGFVLGIAAAVIIRKKRESRPPPKS